MFEMWKKWTRDFTLMCETKSRTEKVLEEKNIINSNQNRCTKTNCL